MPEQLERRPPFETRLANADELLCRLASARRVRGLRERFAMFPDASRGDADSGQSVSAEATRYIPEVSAAAAMLVARRQSLALGERARITPGLRLRQSAQRSGARPR